MERSLERFEYVPRAEKTVRITLAPSEAPGEPIHGELFSNFLENLGASFHGGSYPNCWLILPWQNTICPRTSAIY